MQRHFTAVYQKSGDWWAAHCEEVPGAITQGATLDEARENLRDAISLMLEVTREAAAQDDPGGEIIRENLLVAAP